MNTPTNTAVAAPMPSSMFNRGEATQKVDNVMTSIHSLKLYNKAPGGQEDPQLAGKLLIKSPGMDKYQEFAPSVSMNILKIRKSMNGQYNVLDISGQPMKDNNGETKKGFAFTEEYMRFSKNTTEIFFKDNETGQVVRDTIGNLKQLFKAKQINGQPNRFYKLALDQNNIPYDSTFMKEGYIIYGVFTDGLHAGEYFRLFMSAAAFGNKWDAKTKTSTIAQGSLAAALEEVREKFEAMKTTQGIDGWFDDSHVVTTLHPVKQGEYYKPNFSNNNLITTDNTTDYDFITDLENTYKEQTFNVATQQYAQVEGAQSAAAQIEQHTQVANAAPVVEPVQEVQQPVVEAVAQPVQPVAQQPVATQPAAQPVNNGYAPMPTGQPVAQPAAQPVQPVQNTPVQNAQANQNEGISIEDIPF